MKIGEWWKEKEKSRERERERERERGGERIMGKRRYTFSLKQKIYNQNLS